MARKKKAIRDRGIKWQPKVYHDSRKSRWCVDCGSKFTPRRKFFQAEEEANTYATAKRDEWLSLLAQRKTEQVDNVVVRLSGYSDSQRRDIIKVMGRFGDDTQKLIEAVDFYFQHNPLAGVVTLVKDIAEKYLTFQKENTENRTWRDCQSKLKPFIAEYGERPITSITTAEVKSWMDASKLSNGYSATTFNAHRTAYNGLFNFAKKESVTTHNPIERLGKLDHDQEDPRIHSVKEVTMVLECAKSLPNAHKIVPYLAIGYFAGLRPEREIPLLTWDKIDFIGKTLHVHKDTAKDGQHRSVNMSDNLVAWLKLYAHLFEPSSRIGDHRKLKKKVITETGVKWHQDVMRHSFGSYHFATYEDAGKTAKEMGHQGTAVFFNHYRYLVKKTDALPYWNIKP